VLNAFTTGVPDGTSLAVSSAEEVSGEMTRPSIVSKSIGFAMSTTTLPASWSRFSSIAVGMLGK
jgi:hypothetical protein